ncbi:hypothetical protein [Rhodococcus sp. UNC363MFTsu5.1]|uniref:hypothetical protein n=1 Tax=Rhodococcus sp. UNC363MFTsu5.1 TaxID=1449069 RepID=UPI0004839F02|nr:hypothetical protein [Rhodococcus sp. UNC363MFTsu5.1]
MPTTTALTTPPDTATTSAVPRVLAAAFILSAFHTGYAAVAGIADPTFTVTTPAAWLFYAVGFGSVWLARRPERWAQAGVLAYLVVLLAVSVFYYPTTFTVEKQTVFGWFENDVYVGLLMIATYLTVSRVRSSLSAR